MSQFVQETDESEILSEDEILSEEPVVMTSTALPASIEETESDAQSPIGKIIPVEKLKNGWFTIKNFMIKQSTILVDKVVEVNNSEDVQNFKLKAGETVAKAWTTTKETAVVVGENIQPAMEKAAAMTAEGANTLYNKSTETYSYVTNTYFSDSSLKTQAEGGSEEGTPFPSYTTPSDQASTLGGPITL
jgi:hypothetical protein